MVTKIKLFNQEINGIKVDTSIPCNINRYRDYDERNITYIVVHYTGNDKDTARNNALYFNRTIASASAHFFVDDTSIYQSVDLCDVAWHCGGTKYYHNECRNANSIGIEMCTSGDGIVSERTKENTLELVKALCKLLSIDSKHVLRHYDITHKACPKQMSGENNAEWNKFVVDLENKFKPKVESVVVKPRTWLEKGDKGESVSAMQTMLNYIGVVADRATLRLTVDGQFGANTEKALKDFQALAGLTIDGKYGNQSKAKLTEAYKKTQEYRTVVIALQNAINSDGVGKCTITGRYDIATQNLIKRVVIKNGSKGNICKWVQTRLGAVADGICGTKTTMAIKEFQKTHKLTIDGKCGYNTITAMIFDLEPFR